MNWEKIGTNHQEEKDEGQPQWWGRGESSNVSIVTNQVTLKEIVNSPQGKTLTINKIKARCVSDRRTPVKTAFTPLEASWTTAVLSKDVPHNKKPKLGWKELPKNRMRSKTLLCSNCGGERIFKVPEPNGLGEGSPL
jgi:hypothetical protein